MTTGLTLGKYAPLHKGHQSVIERGLREMDEFLVLIYDAPDATAVPLSVRADWIRQIYPTVEVIEAWDGPTIVGDTPEIKQLNEDYIVAKLDSRRITHFYSSEFYGDHVSRALGAVDCRVDPGRVEVPISGSTVRTDLFAARPYLDPVVYRDLVTWVVFLGAPSTGKTTLCETLAERYNTVWMAEYGREYWDTHQQDRRLSREQLLAIATEHRRREEQLIHGAREWMFVDTDATTTALFSQYYHGEVLLELAALADEAIQRYDLFFLCDDDTPYDDTWDRSGAANRTVFQKQTRADLLRRGTPFFTLRGTLDERVATVGKVLERFEKWTSLPDGMMGNRIE